MTGPFPVERAAVERALADVSTSLVPLLGDVLAPSAAYALDGSGKRVRGIFVLLAHESAGGKRDVAGIAAAVEVVHAYSLVHDDLPCMDDDDYRRGRPTVHRAFGVRAATVAGVAMVPLAVITALRGAERAALSAQATATIVNELMSAGGAGGMIGGQLLDLEAEGRDLSLGELERVHSLKTGALFSAAARIGGIAAGADNRQLGALGEFGAAMGVAFQIADDVLDVTATTERLGKRAGHDAELGKSTFPGAIGVVGALESAHDHVAAGRRALAAANLRADRLEELADYVVGRVAA